MFKDADPRAKLILVALLSSLAVIFRLPTLLGALFLVTLSFLPFFGVTLSLMYRRFRHILLLLFGLFCIQSIFYPGEMLLFHLGPWLTITREGVEMGLSVAFRLGVIITGGLILATAPAQKLIQGLVAWSLPYEIAYMVSLGIRFLPLLRDEAGDILTAIQLRGVNMRALGWWHRLKVYAHIFMPMVTMAILRSRQIAIAMEARAFRAYPQRTFRQPLVLTGKDYVLISTATIIFIFFIYLKLQGGL